MTLTLNLTPDQEANLVAEAARNGLRLEEFALQKLVGDVANPHDGAVAAGTESSAFQQATDRDEPLDKPEAWFKSIGDPNAPPIPLEYLSREALYSGRGEICADPECEQCTYSQ